MNQPTSPHAHGNEPNEKPSSARGYDPSASHDAALSDSPEQLVDQMEQQLAELRERELKAQAELENFRKRVYRDTEQTLKYAATPLVKDILEVLDNLSRATEAASQASDSGSLLEGVKLVQQQLIGVLAKNHCRPIAALGVPFDPNLHQAIAQAPSDQFPAGHVMHEASVGYLLHDRVVRPSHVIVSTGQGS